jgi:hypothetical protein
VNQEEGDAPFDEEHIFSDTFLNFKAILMPYLLKSKKPRGADSSNANDDDEGDEEADTSNLNLPPEVSWHVLNQLRIHAGAPERSELGVEKLCQLRVAKFYYDHLCSRRY